MREITGKEHSTIPADRLPQPLPLIGCWGWLSEAVMNEQEGARHFPCSCESGIFRDCHSPRADSASLHEAAQAWNSCPILGIARVCHDYYWRSQAEPAYRAERG